MRGRARGKYKKDGTCSREKALHLPSADVQYEEENEQARTCVTPLSTPLCNFPRCPLAMHTQTHAYTNTQLELQGDSFHFFR